MFDAIPESKDPEVVHKLPCPQFQLMTHFNAPGKPYCPALTPDDVKSVKGIHWGTWSWIDGKTGDGLAKNADTRDLFKKLHP